MQGSIKEYLHDLIEEGDDRLLNILFAVATEYNDTIEPEILAELQKRTERRRAGLEKTTSWEESKLMITGKKPL